MLRYTETITDPHFLSKFFFSNYLPTHHRRITFDMPESVQFRYKIFNPTPNIEFAEEHKKGRKIYTWQYRNVPKYTSSSEGFPISYYEPHLIPFLMQYTSNGTVHRVTDSLSDLHRWYYSHIEKIDTLQNNVAIKSFTDSLLQNTKTPLDKMNALYYWVQQNIKYVAIEDGYSGIVPRLPSDVLHRRYGDCKDMAALLFSCLRASSIEAHIAWIGTRDIPYRYSEVASSNSDNHMIVLAQIDNKQYFLDGTAVFLPSNLPSDFIQTKEALVSISRNEYRVVEVPKVAKEENQAIDSSYIDLQGNNLNARGSFTATGYEKFNYAVHLIRSEESKQRELMKAALIKGNNKCEITSLSIKPISSREAPLQVAYTYQVPNYARTVGNDIYVNLQLNRFQQNEKIDTVKCGFGKMIDYQYEKHFVVALTIPVGYTVKSTPTAIDYQNADFGFSSKYRFDAAKNVLYLDNVYTVNCLSVCGQQIAQWNVMLDQITKAYSQVVVLTKK